MALQRYRPQEGSPPSPSTRAGLLRRVKRAVCQTPAALTGILCFAVLAFGMNGMGYRFFEIVSGSMEDAIPVGSLTVVQPVDAAALKVGDVIAYRSGPIIITHRIWETQISDGGERVFIAKGDNNSAPDTGEIHSGQIVGRTVLSVPFLGAVLGFVGPDTWGYLMAAVLVGVPVWGLLSFAPGGLKRKSEK